jgi:hypothetical protein
MPIDYNKDIFELYMDAMFYFRDALLENPDHRREAYTVKLSQIFQKLLKGPFPKKFVGSTLPCVKMTGILAGKILQIDSAPVPVRDAGTSKTDAEVEEEAIARLRNILLLVEESTGYKIGTRNDRLRLDLSNCPKRHLVWTCIPHYFWAIKRPILAGSDIKLPESVSRTGSIPINDENSRWNWWASKLFVASRHERTSSSEPVADNTIDPLIGFASPEAQIGDEIVRFLESEFCLVVRSTGSREYKFVGCAIIPVSGDSRTEDSEVMKRTGFPIRGSAPSYAQFHSAFLDPIGYGLDIVIDLEAFAVHYTHILLDINLV